VHSWVPTLGTVSRSLRVVPLPSYTPQQTLSGHHHQLSRCHITVLAVAVYMPFRQLPDYKLYNYQKHATHSINKWSRWPTFVYVSQPALTAGADTGDPEVKTTDKCQKVRTGWT